MPSMPQSKLVKQSIRLTPKLHKTLAAYAAKQETSVQKLLIQLVELQLGVYKALKSPKLRA